MCSLRPGRCPGSLRIAVSGVLTGLSIFLLGGCSSTRAPDAAYRVTAMQKPPVDLEDDGMAAQTPPPARIRSAPDDPSEPWSRNYGVPPEERAERDAQRAAAQPEVLPWLARREVASREEE